MYFDVDSDSNAVKEIFNNPDFDQVDFENLYVKKGHFIWDTLMGDNKIKSVRFFANKDRTDVRVVWELGGAVVGYPEIVHGGLIGALFDQSFGIIMAVKIGRAVTAQLNITYKKPTKSNQTVIVTIKLEKIEGRKIYLKGEMKDIDGNLLSEADSLFVKTNIKQVVERAQK